VLYTPYDWNETIRHRNEYVEMQLRQGSPVAGCSYDGGVLLLTVRGSQRKIFEVYDRLMFSALGKQSDVESVRIAAIDVAHQEGYLRSPDDVTIHRIVGFAVSPFIKRAFNETFGTPLVIRAIFAEVGAVPEKDSFFTIRYDGEFASYKHRAAVAGTSRAEQFMLDQLEKLAKGLPSLDEAVKAALWAWATGRYVSTLHDEEEPNPSTDKLRQVLSDELKSGSVEAAVLERDTKRETRFRILPESELSPILAEFL